MVACYPALRWHIEISIQVTDPEYLWLWKFVLIDFDARRMHYFDAENCLRACDAR